MYLSLQTSRNLSFWLVLVQFNQYSTWYCKDRSQMQVLERCLIRAFTALIDFLKKKFLLTCVFLGFNYIPSAYGSQKKRPDPFKLEWYKVARFPVGAANLIQILYERSMLLLSTGSSLQLPCCFILSLSLVGFSSLFSVSTFNVAAHWLLVSKDFIL